MIFDTEQQKQLVLDLINSASVPGAALEAMYALKQAAIKGIISTVKVDEETCNSD